MKRYKVEATVTREIFASSTDEARLEFKHGIGTAYTIGASVIREMPDPLNTLETARMFRLLKTHYRGELTPEQHGEVVALMQRYELAGSERAG